MSLHRQKKQSTERRKEITLEILKGIGITGLVISSIFFPGVAMIAKLFEEKTGQGGRKTRRAFHTLRRDGAIQIKRKQGGIKIILTEKGKKRLKRLQLCSLKIKKPEIWDGRWRIVMFDVPEAFRWRRDTIRSVLTRLGFIAIQKSIFIHPYPCEEIVFYLRSYYKLRPGELYIFEAKVLEGETVLQKQFKL